MTDQERVLEAIKLGMDVARRNPKPEEPTPSDDYLAWCIVNEIRRAGFAIVPKVF